MNREERIGQYRIASRIADNYIVSGKFEQAIAVIREQITNTIADGDEDYRLFFEGELLNYERHDYSSQLELIQQSMSWQSNQGMEADPFIMFQKGICLTFLERSDEALVLFDKVISIDPTDYHALREKGLILSNQGKNVEAIALYDLALAINPRDIHTLRNKGCSFFELGKKTEAIALFNQALEINPNDIITLRNKGVSLSKEGQVDDAIACFKQAIEIQADDAASYRAWAIALYNNDINDGVLECIRKATYFRPNQYKDDFFFVVRSLGMDAKSEWEKLIHEIEKEGNTPTVNRPFDSIPTNGDIDPLSDIRGFVARIRAELGPRGNELLEGINKARERVADFLLPETKREQERSEFQILRKWNSYTPAIPAVAEDNRSRGGGYFIYHSGKGIVIDPGYNFIENFHEAGGRIHDIDTIVITHAHNDHTTDFESLCTLLYKYNSEIKEPHLLKKVSIYLNNGAYKKFSGLLNLQDHFYIDKVYTLNQGNRYTMSNGIDLLVLPAFHDELISRDQSIGLLFSIPFSDEICRKLLFTSDTGLFPLKLEGNGFVPNTDGKRELWQEYPVETLNGVDVLVAHIGSVNKNEILVDVNKGVHECLYPNHLGVIGVCRILSTIPSELAVVSEFGEELRNFRCLLVRQIDRIVKEVLKDAEKRPVVLPGDLAFRYDIGARKIFCCESDQWIPCEEVRYQYKDVSRKEDILYLSQEAAERL